MYSALIEVRYSARIGGVDAPCLGQALVPSDELKPPLPVVIVSDDQCPTQEGEANGKRKCRDNRERVPPTSLPACSPKVPQIPAFSRMKPS